MQIGLFDEGGLLDLPNLAIARYAAYYRARGAEVQHNRLGRRYDLAIISCIFAAHWPKMRQTIAALDAGEIRAGGPGYSLAADSKPPWATLPSEIEATPPDLSMWPDWPWSLDYSYRGCIRRCDFCVVPRQEGRQLRRAAGSYLDMLRPEARTAPKGHHLVDLANNILAAPEQELAALWSEVHALGLTLDYCQGLDVRLMTQAIAEEIASLPLYTRWQNKRGQWRKAKRLYLALDHSHLIPRFERAAKWLLKAGVTGRNIFVYILERPGEEADTLTRIQVVARLGLKPYVMPLNDHVDSGLRRWVNRRYYEFVPWEKYQRRRSDRQMALAGNR